MESQRKKEETAQSSETKKVKEVKGVADDPPSFSDKKDPNKMVKKADDNEVKGLPHLQVPQPGDFSSEALEHL